VYGEHSTLKGKVHAFTIIDPVGRQLSLTKGETFDYDRHGTHVCGTIAGGESSDGNAIGVAPDAKLVVAQVHFGQRAFLSSVVDGIGWAITQGASVINMSIGTNYYEEKFDVLFKWLVERDIAPVVSIGNNSHGSTHSPGNASYALGVGAVQKSNGAVEVAPFSGGGSLDFPGNPLSRIIKPDVVAPGAEVWSCVPSLEPDVDEYRYMDGTSMAAPHAAGVVAVLMAACPKKSVLEIFQAIKETANHPRGKNLRPDNRWGYGMIDPLAALDALRQS
jgi:subtilisin family serine protease